MNSSKNNNNTNNSDKTNNNLLNENILIAASASLGDNDDDERRAKHLGTRNDESRQMSRQLNVIGASGSSFNKKKRKSKSTTTLIRRLFLCGSGGCGIDSTHSNRNSVYEVRQSSTLANPNQASQQQANILISNSRPNELNQNEILNLDKKASSHSSFLVSSSLVSLPKKLSEEEKKADNTNMPRYVASLSTSSLSVSNTTTSNKIFNKEDVELIVKATEKYSKETEIENNNINSSSQTSKNESDLPITQTPNNTKSFVLPLLKINDDDTLNTSNETGNLVNNDDDRQLKTKIDVNESGEKGIEPLISRHDELPDEEEVEDEEEEEEDYSQDTYDNNNYYDQFPIFDEEEEEDEEEDENYFRSRKREDDISIKEQSNRSQTVLAQPPELLFSDDIKINVIDDTSVDNEMNKDHENENNDSKLSLTSCYSKFLTANNLMTDRGCIVNIRTGSFNLGSQGQDQDELSEKDHQNRKSSSNSLMVSSTLGASHLNHLEYDKVEKLNSTKLDVTGSSSLQNNGQRCVHSANNISSLCNNNNEESYSRSSFISSVSLSSSSSSTSVESNRLYDSLAGSNVLIPLLMLNKRRRRRYAKNKSRNNTVPLPIISINETNNCSSKFEVVMKKFDSVLSTSNETSPNIKATSFTNTLRPAPSIGSNGGTNSLLAPNNEQMQDQLRRSSHDPNMEKLHKTYISNVKLLGNNPNGSGVGGNSGGVIKLDSLSVTDNSLTTTATTTTTHSFTSDAAKMAATRCGTIDDSESSIISISVPLLKRFGDNQKDEYEYEHEEEGDLTPKDEQIIKPSEKILSEMSKVDKWLNSQNNKSLHEQNTETAGQISGRNVLPNDSAIDIRSYGSISTLSKVKDATSMASTDAAVIAIKSNRCNWHSFTKYYNMHFYQSAATNNSTAWSKYQISAMSLEQLMALRKLALIQFSKLIERQHSSMIRTFKLFSKKIALEEFQQSYGESSSTENAKFSSSTYSNSKQSDQYKTSNLMLINKEIIDCNNNANINQNMNKKISYQLGAQVIYTSVNCSSSPTNTKLSVGDKKPLEKTISNPTEPKDKLASKQESMNNSANKKSLTKKQQSDDLINYNVLNEINKNQANTSQNTSNIVNNTNKNETKPNATNNDSNNKLNKPLVFSQPLSVIMQQTGQPLPQRIIEAMKFIRRVSANEVGIFRKNGNKTRINKLKECINQDEKINFNVNSDELTVYDIADMIKLYFRELPECLITNKLSDILLSNYSKIRPEERKIILQQVMLLIPDENRLVLQTLLLFLNEIAKYHRTNQMTRNNLAVCFSPVIFNLNYEMSSKKKIKPSKTIHYHNNPPSFQSPTNQIIKSVVKESISETPQNEIFLQQQQQQKSQQLNISTSNNTQLSKSNPNLFLPPSPQTPSNSNSVEEDINLKTNKAIDLPLMTPCSSSSFEAVNQSNNTDNKKLATSVLHNFESTSSSINFGSPATSNEPLKAQPAITTKGTLNKSNSRRKYSDRLNRAANTLVQIGAEISSNTSTVFFSSTDPVKDNLENMNKVVQLCVSDMIKYSIDLFTVPVENFEKLKLSVSYGSEPYNLEYLYDIQQNKIKKHEFFSSNINIDKSHWFYFDKYEQDVSIYYFKNEYSTSQPSQQQTQQQTNAASSNTFQDASSGIISANSMSLNSNSISGQSNAMHSSSINNHKITDDFLLNNGFNLNDVMNNNAGLYLPQKNESFNNKLKLWKCCTLIKQQNMTLEKILNRIKNERHLWDDDFREGRVVERLDDQTDLYRYVISFMPPHPSRDFYEIRHSHVASSVTNASNPTLFGKSSFDEKKNMKNPMVVLTSTSVQQKTGNKLIGDIRANMLISKYVIEKLIATDTTTTFKITHYVKLDYKGFTLEFYNKTFGYMMARLLHKLKMSLLLEEDS